ELTVTTDLDGISLLVEPKVVEPNHHSRRLLRLTGIGANENQARAMLNDLDSFRSDPALTDVDDLDESQAARRWLEEVYKPLIQAIPENLTRKLEPGQIFYEFAEHRRTMARARQRDIPIMEAIAYFIVDYLATLPAEIRYVDSEQFCDLAEAAPPRTDPHGRIPMTTNETMPTNQHNPTLPSLFDLSGRTAVVVGAGSGLGQASAIGLADAGAHVIAADLNLSGADDTASLIAGRGAGSAQP